ncbi:unnamed protein product [Caenorhabditis bovis]|uniref:Carboxylesterase type B domain-containing protein n=1 Tax=Caenorhabditis bovis TaxID=2654633 RepID=A0A8S1FAS0_9PELO|nr:unnamed protein product [Caenorhabditis bovis]
MSLLVVLLFLPFLSFNSECRILRIDKGKIEGAERVFEGNRYYLFKRIPFAAPPLGKLRFQKAADVKNWKNVWNSTEYGPACMSNSSVTKSPQKWVDEDCLHTNVFTSQACLTKKNCPVAFYIHGGGMNYDSAVMFNDTMLLKTFVSKDIVLVISAFRLGIFSHFIVNDQSVAPHNIGVFDILKGLHFVHDNIKHFGGDPNRVTLFGHSFGASVAGLMGFSPAVDPQNKLFHQIVCMSPAISFYPLRTAIQNTYEFAKQINCSPPKKLSQKSGEQFMLECLQSKDQMELLQMQHKLDDSGAAKFLGLIQTLPLFEGNIAYEAFKKPKKLALLTGTTRQEFERSLHQLPVGNLIDFKNQVEVDSKYRKDLKNGNTKFNYTDDTLEVMITSRVIANKFSEPGSKAFMYQYLYPKHNHHTDDLAFIMGVHAFEQDENEQVLAELYPKYFTNFVKYGNPDKDWKPTNQLTRNYFAIDWNSTSGLRPHMEDYYEKEVSKYWLDDMKVYDKYITAKKVENRINIFEIHKKIQKVSVRSLETYHQTSNFYNYWILVGLIFVLGIIVGRYTCRSKRNVYIRLNGYDYQEVVKPF